MKAKRFTEEQIIAVLKQVEAESKTKELCRQPRASVRLRAETRPSSEGNDASNSRSVHRFLMSFLNLVKRVDRRY